MSDVMDAASFRVPLVEQGVGTELGHRLLVTWLHHRDLLPKAFGRGASVECWLPVPAFPSIIYAIAPVPRAFVISVPVEKRSVM
jgi:hypothetical protein